ncbi:MAG: alpha/beta hydrolase [Dehalococcoidia bacterium]|nr:MAG: alpha/beta hydrolase [Dehalococcoidia bacterium]
MTTNGARPALPGRPDNVLRLTDGRLLGYGDFGDPNGTPLMMFHGFPGSRVTSAIGHEAAARAGVRVIAPDRPGMGLSTFQRGRRILDWPADVVQLADALGLSRFAVAGVSGGGPYAAVCALRLADRLTGAAIISGVAPFDAPDATQGMNRMNRILFTVAGRAPWLARLPMLLFQFAARSPERAIDRAIGAMPEADRAIMRRREVRALFADDFAEAFRAGSRGPAWELVLYARPWGFRLQDIAMEVHLWQGEADKNVPVVMGRYQAAAIPNCRATFFPGEGHLLIIDRMEEILGAAVARPVA